MIILKSKFFLGVFGERIVHESLPGSEWMRVGYGMGRDPFDIMWNGIKIEVKTSRSFYGDKNSFHMQFSLLRAEASIFVFLGIMGKTIYWWVKSKKEFNSSVYLKSENAFTDLSLLPIAILKAKNRKNNDVEVAYGNS